MYTTDETVPFNQLVLPPVVYKYRRWNSANHRTVLTHARFMFEKPLSMGPNSEMKYRLDGLANDQLLLYYRQLMKKLRPDATPSERLRMAVEEFTSSNYKDTGFVNQQIQDLFRQYNDMFGALCLGKTNVNKRLWEHFASSGHGFCVGFNPKMIINATDFWLGEMEYYSPNMEPTFYFPSIDSATYTRDIFKICLSLPEHLNEEEEFRIFRVGHGAINCPKEAISEVIIGYDMAAGPKAELIRTVEQHLPDVRLSQCEMDRQTGSLTVLAIS